MKNFIVASVLGKSRQQQQPPSADQNHQSNEQVSHKSRNIKAMIQPSVMRTAIGRRTELSVNKERPRGKSCDRMMANRNESHHYNGEWNDDGGFGQWRAIHHRPSSPTRPDGYFHHARPISVSITDRIQLVLQQERQQKQQQMENALQEASNNHRFDQPFASSSSSSHQQQQFYPEYYHPHRSVSGNGCTMRSWAYQSGSSSEEAVAGPQSLDSQWAVRQEWQQQQNNHRVNHPSYPVGASTVTAQPPASSLSRKLSTYGTLPRNRQRFFMAKYQSK